MVVVGDVRGLRGLDRTTGEERWTSPVRLHDDSGVGVARGAAAVTGNTVIVPAAGKLVAIDARTGTELWQGQELHRPSAVEGFVVGYQGKGPSPKVIALDSETGETLWTATGRPSYGDLWAIGGGAVSVLEVAPGIVAYELATGTVRWRRGDQMGQPQSAVGDAVYVLWESYLAVLSSTDRSTRWEANAPLGSPWMHSLGSNTGSLFVSVDTLPPGD
jgi:outer membrane protein assembly factor BamB